MNNKKEVESKIFKKMAYLAKSFVLKFCFQKNTDRE